MVIVTYLNDLLTPFKGGKCDIQMFKEQGIPVTTQTIKQPDRDDGQFQQETIHNCDIYYNTELKHLHLSHGQMVSNDDEYTNKFLEGAKVYNNIMFSHSDLCMARTYVNYCKDNQIEPAISPNNIRLAVCMAIHSKDGNLLLTKRAATIKFPNEWVMPGGHIDVGESLEECVVREVREETGIEVSSDALHIQPFYLFESNTGKTTGPEIIKNGHLIVFFRAQLDVNSSDIKLVTQISEVQ